MTVICKATFQLIPGVSRLCEQQEELNAYENHWNDDESRSLYAPTDFVPFKPLADVLVVGSAYAPRRQPAQSILTRLKVGSVDKSIEVFPDQWLESDGAIRDSGPIVKMSLRYERAAMSRANPVGIPHRVPRAQGHVSLPNLRPPHLSASQLKSAIQSIGFGPLALTWPDRGDRLTTTALRWAQEQRFEMIMPDAFDPTVFNAAPHDQQLNELTNDCEILLENLHAEHSVIQTKLPGICPKVTVELRGSPSFALNSMRADTLWIDTDRGICTVTWRGQTLLGHLQQDGRVIVDQTQGTPSSFSSAPYAMIQAPQSEGSAKHARRQSAPSHSDVFASHEPAETDPEQSEMDSTILVSSDAKAEKVPLPFASPQPGAPQMTAPQMVSPPASKGAQPRDVGDTQTILPSAAIAAVMPFLGKVATAHPLPQPPDAGPQSAPAESVMASPKPVQPPHIISHESAQAKNAVPASPWALGAASNAGSENYSFKPTQTQARAVPISEAIQSESGTSEPGKRVIAAKTKVVSLASRKERNVDTHSALGASNAAAGVAMVSGASAVPGAEPPSPPAERKALPLARTAVELLWYESSACDSITRIEPWKQLLETVKPKARDADSHAETSALKKKEAKERRELSAIMAQSMPEDIQGITASIQASVDEDGTFVPPLVLVGGELEFPFDELETLKATLAAVTPLMSGDLRLKEKVDAIQELLRTPWLQSASTIADGLVLQLKEIFAQGNRILPARYLETHTDRILLENRHYQKRVVLGHPSLRSLLTPAGSSVSIPVYLPGTLARELPMFQKFSVRMIAEVRPQLDQYESNPVCLRALAIGRVISQRFR